MGTQYKKRYLVFLDVDGVFTSSRVHYAHNSNHSYKLWTRFDPVAVDFMNKIYDRYENVEFVLMSTWKNNLPLRPPVNRDDPEDPVYHWIESALRNAGFRGPLAEPFRTNPSDSSELDKQDRAYEVLDYLNNHGDDVTDYILFDDKKHQFAAVLPKNRLVHTDSENGLLYKHMVFASSIVGQWNER